MKKLILSLLLTVLTLMLIAETFHYNLDFPSPKLEPVSGKYMVAIDGLVNTGLPGEPSLPAYALKILLPPSQAVTGVTVTGKAMLMALPGEIYPVQQQYPLSQMGTGFTPLNDDVRSMNAFPEESYGNPHLGFFRGYRIYTLLIYPARYLPQQEAISFYPNLDIAIETGIDKESRNALSTVRGDEETLRRLSQMVINPQDAMRYSPTQRNRDYYDYLIITPEAFMDAFSVLADYKNGLGIRTQIASAEEILESTTGTDDQDKIRNYIIEQYEQSGIQYVLIAGDDENLPHRGFWLRTGAITDADIPCDLYFFNLDGDWDGDGDGIYGEPFETDYYSEVYGARAPVDTVEEAQNFVNKQILYQTQPVTDDLNTALMAGEYLGWTNNGRDYMEEIHQGCDLYGFTTAGVPENINVTTLYDVDDYWGGDDLRVVLNGGMHLVSHIGHGSVHNALRHYPEHITTENLTNDGVNHTYYIIYTQSCYSCAFDNRDAFNNESEIDCMAEQWVTLETGAVCFIGNTRFGLGSSTNTNGASQHYQREFFDALFGENITCIAQAQTDSRDDSVPFIVPGNQLQWAFYVTTLLGDSTLDLWTDAPAQVTVEIPDSLDMGSTSIELVVTTVGSATGDILVGAIFEGEVIGKVVTQSGQPASLVFDTPPMNPGILTIAVSGHNLPDTYCEVPVEGLSIDEVDSHLPSARLYPVYPNPVRSQTGIQFSLKSASDVDVAIYNVKGQRVAALASGKCDAGLHQVTWNCRNQNGSSVASGIYFVCMKIRNQVLQRKMLLLK